MNTSLDNLTHKMQRAALGKIVDVALSRAEQDRKKTMCQLVDAAKQFYGSGFSDETYENAKKVLTDPNSKWTKLINCVLDQTTGLYIDEPVEFMDDAMAALRYGVERPRRGSSIEVLK